MWEKVGKYFKGIRNMKRQQRQSPHTFLMQIQEFLSLIEAYKGLKKAN